MADSEHSDDRRVAPREKAYVGVEMTTPDEAAHLGVLQDASSTGLAFLTRAKVDEGTPVRIAILVEDERRLELAGEVVRRVDHDGDGPWRWRVAVTLTEPSEELAEHAAKVHAQQGYLVGRE